MLLGCVRAVYRVNIFEINFFNAFVGQVLLHIENLSRHD